MSKAFLGHAVGTCLQKHWKEKGEREAEGKKETRWKREGEEKEREGRESELEGSYWENSVTASKAQVTKVKERNW